MTPAQGRDHIERERAYYDDLYSGFAQQHFAKPGVVAFRRDLVRSILRRTAINKQSRVLSVGCGIGDTETLLAPHAGEILGVDLSPKAVEHARKSAPPNLHFEAGEWQSVTNRGDKFDTILAIFFLHHLSDSELKVIPAQLMRTLRPGGVFYALEPSEGRLSERIGKLLFPALMRRYQTEDERALRAETVTASFGAAGFDARFHWFDFGSLPMAGLLPGSSALYKAARSADEVLIRTPGVNRWSNAFELVARVPLT